MIRRIAPPKVIPLELWDLELSSGILWDHMEAGALPSALGQAIARLRRGSATTRSRAAIPARARDLAAVWLAGGRAVDLDPSPLAASLGVPVWCADDPTGVAARGARALLPEASPPAVIDLGQSRLKIVLGGERFVHERPRDQLPLLELPAPVGLASGVTPHVSPEQIPGERVGRDQARARLRAWVSGALTDASARTRCSTDAVVFALPCALTSSPTPGSCSYLGLEGDARFVPDVLTAAGWAPRTVLVLNDAELAAVAAGLDARCQGSLTLVLTLGFGVGGALLLP